MERVGVITGGNSGIGFSLAQRLLSEGVGEGVRVRVCLACRNMERAEAARQSLIASSPGSLVDIIQVDMISVGSVKAACAEIERRYDCVDWIFCNAGMMPVSGINWRAFWPPTPSNLAYQLRTGGELTQVRDSLTQDGLQQIFSTNLFGHFVMLKELEGFLSVQARDCHVIWTSSSTASRVNFDPRDIQGKSSGDPYAYSKRAVDLISREINCRMNSKGVYSSTVCPGLVATQLTYKILPQWVWSYILVPILILLRVCLHSMTMTPFAAAEALLWLARQRPSSVDHTHKYFSHATITGHRYVATRQIEASKELSAETWTQVDTLCKTFR